MNERKLKQLIAAICRVNDLCNELQIPELLGMDANERVLKACEDRWKIDKAEFLMALAPTVTTRKQ